MEMLRFSPYRGFSVRSILSFVLAVIITALLWAILSSPAAHAANAEWEGASIKYDGVQYISAGTIQKDDGSGLTVDSPYYLYVEQYQAPGSSTKTDRARVIYFSPGVDPPKETKASLIYFDYNLKTKQFSNPGSVTEITLTPQAESANGGGTSCAIEGIGWMVCPIMNFLAGGMDFIFGIIAQYMAVQPLETGNIQGSLYSAWSIMRNIANVAFIIAFLIIIYAQITSYKTAEFGLKRLLPRLIIAAVAINVSYIICAVAVDISNILGYSLQDVFYSLRDQILDTGSTDNTAQILSWESVTGFVISGGTAALAGVAGVGGLIVAAGGSITAAVFLLLPSLVGLLIAILVVLLILAARQALIVILVIIAPIAIVLYLLPNTEKWFDKWRGLFLTLLIFFPAFSVVFGGSQLAGAVIIKNATSINLVILGMIVQVAPLVITPLLLKFSGNLLGSIARLVNDPNKGILDRTRKWSGEHAKRHAARGLDGTKWNGDPSNRGAKNPLKRSARYLDQRKRRRADLTSNSEMGAQTNYENSARYIKTDRKGNEKYNMAAQKAAFEADKSMTHDSHNAHVEAMKLRPGSLMYNRAINVQAAKESVETAQNRTNEHFNTQRTIGGTALNYSMMQLESSKLRVETSDNNKNIYVSQEKQRAGSMLNGLVDTYESSKVNLEGSQSRYTAMVDAMKVDTSKQLHIASINAQSGKDQVEIAQQNLQAMFDNQRATPGSVLNVDLQNLEVAKGVAEGARAKVADYIATEKSTIGTQLHTTTIETEMLKQKQQVSEASLTRIVEEYKAGGKRVVDETTGVETVLINNQVVTGTQQTLADTMLRYSEDLSAELQGAESAKSEREQRIATAFSNLDDTRTDDLLQVAGSIDANGAQRAQANALAKQSRHRKDTLDNLKAIFGFRNATDKQIRELAEGKNTIPGVDVTSDSIAAAIQATFSSGNTAEVLAGLTNIDFSFPGNFSDAEREEFRVLAADALKSNSSKPPFVTMGTIAAMKIGQNFAGDQFTGAYNEAGIDKMIIKSINDGKLDSNKLQSAGKDYAEAVKNAVARHPDLVSPMGKDGNPSPLDSLLRSLAQTLDPRRRASEGLGDSKPFLMDVFKQYGGHFDKNGMPILPKGVVPPAPDTDEE